MKNVLLMLMCLLLVASFVAARGGGERGPVVSDLDILTDTPGSVRIVRPGNELTLSIFTTQRPATDSYEYEDNWFTRYMTDNTGIEFEWIVATAEEGSERLTLLMTSGDYTDVILHEMSLAEQAIYSSQGILLPLDDMIEEWGPNTQEAFAQFEELLPMFRMNDGNLYGLPGFNTCVHCQVTGKLWVYQPWLDALGLEPPETTEEFYQMLVAFKEDDPNGNGIADEIPMAGAQQGWQTQIDIFLMNAFVYSEEPSLKRLYVEDRIVTASYVQPGWREGLRYINRLYEEGLIAPESLTQRAAQLQQIGENEGINILGAAPGGFHGTFSTIQGDSGRWLEFETLKPLVGPAGFRATRYAPFTGNVNRFYITDRAANPVAAFRLGDLFYDDYIQKIGQNGEEGVSWREPQPGELGLDGEPGWVYYLQTVQERRNDSWRQKLPESWNHSSMILDAPLEHILYQQSFENYFPYVPELDQMLPPLIWDAAEAAEVAELQTTINDYVNEMLARFIAGDIDIDTGWDDYVEELGRIGLGRYLDLHQEAFDARY